MKETLELALEALEEAWYHVGTFQPTEKAIDLYDEARTAIKEALAQPKEPEPVKDWIASHNEICALLRQARIYDAINALKALDKQEPVALMIYRGELCYKSQDEDQSFGMWFPVTQDLPFPEGTKFYTTPPQRKPLTDEDVERIALDVMGFAVLEKEQAETALMLIRATEVAHNIKE